MTRDYKKEYARDHASVDAKKKRAMRNLWNRRLKGEVPKGHEIDHITPLKNGGTNDKSNIRFRLVSENRGDKSMFKKQAFTSAALGALGADEGIENKAVGAAAGQAAGWAATPAGAALGLEYLRRKGGDLEFMSRKDMYKALAKSPLGFVKGLGAKNSAIVGAGTFVTGVPAAYLAGKTFGTGYDDKDKLTKTSGFYFHHEAPMEKDRKVINKNIKNFLESEEFKHGINAYTSKPMNDLKRKVKNKLKDV
jgi:hypothetical protein